MSKEIGVISGLLYFSMIILLHSTKIDNQIIRLRFVFVNKYFAQNLFILIGRALFSSNNITIDSTIILNSGFFSFLIFFAKKTSLWSSPALIKNVYFNFNCLDKLARSLWSGHCDSAFVFVLFAKK